VKSRHSVTAVWTGKGVASGLFQRPAWADKVSTSGKFGLLCKEIMELWKGVETGHTYQEKQEVKLGGTAGPNSPTARDERKSKGTKGNCS
jgi:hypothetical protein